jgi:GNAT superfamily N-acetyltransferase
METPEITFRAGRTGDGETIANFFAIVQNTATLPLTIWSSPRASKYVDDVLAGRHQDLQMEFYMVDVDDVPEGCICVRNVGGRVFFDNIYVSPHARKLQLAGALILYATEDFVRRFCASATEAAWDVWAHERALRAWYRQLGGVEQSRQHWYRIPPTTGDTHVEVFQTPDAIQRQDAYGFSMLEVISGQENYTVGLLGDHAYRITDAAGCLSPEVLRALARFDERRCVYLNSPSPEPPDGAEEVATAIRLHSPLPVFTAAVSRVIPSGAKLTCVVNC